LGDSIFPLYFQDLIDELKSELGGDMENLVVAMLLSSDVFYARELDKAMTVSVMGSGRRSWGGGGEGGLPYMGSYESSADLRRAFRQEILKAIFLF
jgi:hypothetical protein